jgi:AraC-like DNA-binding protein
MTWLFIDTAIRAAAGGIILVLGWTIWRDGTHRLAARLTGLLCLAVIAHLVAVAPAVPKGMNPWDLPFEIASITVPPLFWLVALAVFVDDYRPRPLHVVLAAAHSLYGVLFIAVLLHSDTLRLPAGALLRSAMFGFVIAALVVAWRGRADDLVEDRRRLRDLLIWSIGILALAIPTMEVFLFAGLLPIWSLTVSAATILAVTLVNAWFLVGLRDDDLLRRAAAAVAAAAAAAPPPADADEPRMLAALARLMQEERLYRDDDLSIARLADKVGVPEYRLRRLINQRLGHRNFAAYLASYRLLDVKAALADPAQAGVPILTIALDAGFGSLAPFNRAFREAEGMTPSEYREQARKGEGPGVA